MRPRVLPADPSSNDRSKEMGITQVMVTVELPIEVQSHRSLRENHQPSQYSWLCDFDRRGNLPLGTIRFYRLPLK